MVVIFTFGILFYCDRTCTWHFNYKSEMTYIIIIMLVHHFYQSKSAEDFFLKTTHSGWIGIFAIPPLLSSSISEFRKYSNDKGCASLISVQVLCKFFLLSRFVNKNTGFVHKYMLHVCVIVAMLVRPTYVTYIMYNSQMKCFLVYLTFRNINQC